MKKKLLVPVLFMGMALPLCLSAQKQGVSAEFIGDYSTSSDREDYIKAGSELNKQICDEGFVLLKNRDNFLPMNPQGKKISLVGKSSANLVRGGGGSGTGSVNGEENWQLVGDSEFNVKGALEESGFEVNKAFPEFYGKWAKGSWGNSISYSNNSKSGPGRTNGNDGWQGNSQVQIGETPLSLYSAELLATLDTYKDAAIQVISREGSEGCDVKAVDARDYDPASGSSLPSGVTWDDPTKKHALELSDNEQDLFDELKKHTDNIIIVINSGNIFQCDQFEHDPKVAAILWIGNPGSVGASSVGRILTGEVNPSGRTVDTWARDFTKDPTFQNFSDNAQTNDTLIEVTVNEKKKQTYASQDTMFASDGKPMLSYGTDKNYESHSSPRWLNESAKVVQGGLNGVKPASYVAYEEGIYVDYRYYETRYADMAAKNKDTADTWYDGEEGVIYPFGYGLSYTSFEQTIVSSNVNNLAIKGGNAKVQVEVKVKNTGKVAGKEVVQLYWKAPYKKGGIEKADRVLCAFDKTKLLEPGEEQNLKLSFDIQDFANYDFSDANKNKFKGYELEKGTYYVTLNKNAHDEIDSVKFSISSTIKFNKDRYTGNEVKNRFTDRGFYSSMPGKDDIGFEQFSRKDLSNKPHAPTFEERTVGEKSRYEEFLTHEFTMEDMEFDDEGLYVPLEVRKTKEDIEALGWTQRATTASKAESIQFSELVGLDMDDPKWEQAMNQMTYEEMIGFSYGGGDHNQAIERMGKPGTGDSDGPSQFIYVWWAGAPIVAATYNVELAQKQGEMVGMEAHISGTYGWAGPAVNLHRSPFGGRNFEYYAADPFLMGRMAGRVVAGATDKGLYCFFKHFAVNDQEKNREGSSSFLTEQALREIYLKPFQMVVQEGKSMAIMSSYNRLGLMETAASYPLLTEVLRQEWGFKGHIISDMTHSNNASVNFKCYENVNNRILSGCNQQLDSNGFKKNIECSWNNNAFDGKGAPVFKRADGTLVESYSWWYALRNNVKETMWTCANCGVMSKVCVKEAGLTFEGFTQARFEANVGTQIEINIGIPEELKVGKQLSGKNIASVALQIDPVTPLPKGLSLEGNQIKGKVEESFNGFVHVLAKVTFDDNTTQTLGSSMEFLAPKVNTANKIGKKGCFGSFEVTMAGAAFIAVAGSLLLLANKKRKANA